MNNRRKFFLAYIKANKIDITKAVRKISRRAKNLTCPACDQIYEECLCPLYEPDGTSHKTGIINYDYINDVYTTEDTVEDF